VADAENGDRQESLSTEKRTDETARIYGVG